MFWVISVYFNIRNTLPKSGTFLLGHLYNRSKYAAVGILLKLAVQECALNICHYLHSLITHSTCLYEFLQYQKLSLNATFSPQCSERLRSLMSLFNPLDVKLNPICHLLALLGAHRILHVSRVRVNGSWKRLLRR